ncbi:dCMP deaminase [Candidatus Peregrinibacteria bacterium CG_4_10_14_0_2_um_filter_43_11]|nr:MAG: dCMP deaminase [Candidatus Peregrinibacteria bacterium CG_4_10_14_0_2_um_filter_43_11]
MTYHRPSKDEYFMTLAHTIASRGTCPKAKVGALLVKDGSIISTGYNGSPVGEKHCYEAGCNEADGHCQRAVHAELNAILQAAKHGNSTKDATLYITHFPCNHCLKAIRNCGITGIVYEKPYKTDENFISLSHFEIRQIEVTIKDIKIKEEKLIA